MARWLRTVTASYHPHDATSERLTLMSGRLATLSDMCTRHARWAAVAVVLVLVSVGDTWMASPRAAVPQQVLAPAGDIAPVHDPVAIKEKGTYYVFCTGGRNGQGVIPIRTSTDMRRWAAAGFVFESLPAWAAREIPRHETRGRQTLPSSTASTISIIRSPRSAAAIPPSGWRRREPSIDRAPTTDGSTRGWCCDSTRTRTTGMRSTPTS